MEKTISKIYKNMDKEDYQTIFELMNKYDKLPKLSKMILNKLWVDDFQGNYTDFTKHLELSKQHISNVTKALKHLEKLGIVCIVRKHSTKDKLKRNDMTVCYIVDGWFANLLKSNDEELKTFYNKVGGKQKS